MSELCNITPTFGDFDPFFVGRNNRFCTLPWEPSHGSPQIVPQGSLNKILLAGANTTEGCGVRVFFIDLSLRKIESIN